MSWRCFEPSGSIWRLSAGFVGSVLRANFEESAVVELVLVRKVLWADWMQKTGSAGIAFAFTFFINMVALRVYAPVPPNTGNFRLHFA